MLPCNLVPAVQVAINNSTHLHTKNSLWNVSQHILKINQENLLLPKCDKEYDKSIIRHPVYKKI